MPRFPRFRRRRPAPVDVGAILAGALGRPLQLHHAVTVEHHHPPVKYIHVTVQHGGNVMSAITVVPGDQHVIEVPCPHHPHDPIFLTIVPDRS